MVGKVSEVWCIQGLSYVVRVLRGGCCEVGTTIIYCSSSVDVVLAIQCCQ
jgi:hypothetical protein